MNKMKKWTAGVMVAAFCLAELLTPMTGLAAEVISYSKVVSDTPGEAGSNYSGSSTSPGTTLEDLIKSGPGTGTVSGSGSGTGMTAGSDSSGTAGNGPKLVDVTPTERYYEEYDIYSESINGQYFFYSNVGNNGMTSKPVSVDFPANISYTMEKDGVVTPYTSKQKVSDYGTYLFRILITEDAAKPVSEQTVYRSVFMFRIQPKAEKPAAASGQTESGTGNGTVSEAYNMLSGVGDLAGQYGQGMELEGLTDLLTSAADELDNEKDKELLRNLLQELAAEKESASAEDSSGETQAEVESITFGESEPTDENRGDAESKAADEEKEKTAAAVVDANPMASLVHTATSYISARGTYRTEFEDGSFVEVTTPNGMIGNTKVYVSLEGLKTGNDMTLLKNGKEEALPEGGVFDQPGSYCLLCRTEGGIYPYSFRILDVADSYLDYYTLPEGVELTSFEIDGRPVDPEIYQDSNGVTRLDFTKEGFYSISMSDPKGLDFDAELVIDRTPPKVSVEKGKGKVNLSYNAQEVKEIILKDKEGETSFVQLDEVTTPGSYEAEFYDYAGNVTRVSFEVKRQINLATLAVIGMAIVLLVLAIVLYRRTKHQMDVM